MTPVAPIVIPITATPGQDISAEINLALNDLGSHGGDILLPGGAFTVEQSILVGTGNMSNIWSSRQGVRISGQGGGFGVYGGAVPTLLQWAGPANTFMFDVRGRISGVEISRLAIDCASVGDGVYLGAVSGSRFSDIKIIRPKNIGVAVIGGGAPVGNYNIYNVFENISVNLMVPNSKGLFMDGNGFGDFNNDTWLTQFRNTRIETVAGAFGAICAHFRFMDSCSFYRCHFEASPEPSSTGLVLDALNNDGFPCGNGFYDCSVSSIQVLEDENHKIRKNTFLNHGTYDGEVIPAHPAIVGITDTGRVFNDYLSGVRLQSMAARESWSEMPLKPTAATGAFTDATATTRHYCFGKICHFQTKIVIPNNGTAAGAILVPLPQNAKSHSVFAGRNMTTGAMLQAVMNPPGNVLSIWTSANGYPGGTGHTLNVSGSFEVA